MKNFLIVTDTDNNFSELVSGLKQRAEVKIHWADSVKTALQTAADSLADLMIIDEKVSSVSGLDVARAVIQKNAMINLAVVSTLSSEEFHEESEGLGIMAHLPPLPGSQEAGSLLEALAEMP